MTLADQADLAARIHACLRAHAKDRDARHLEEASRLTAALRLSLRAAIKKEAADGGR